MIEVTGDLAIELGQREIKLHDPQFSTIFWVPLGLESVQAIDDTVRLCIERGHVVFGTLVFDPFGIALWHGEHIAIMQDINSAIEKHSASLSGVEITQWLRKVCR